MKHFVSLIGMLAIAQLIFVALVHVFITVQDKRSPETLAKLHDLPVIGGYFPAVDLPTNEEQASTRLREQRTEIIEAREFFNLPDFPLEELTTLSEDVRDQKQRLVTAEKGLEERRAELDTLIQEIARREENIATGQEAIDRKVRELELQYSEVAAQQAGIERKADAQQQLMLKKLAKIYNEIEPERAAALLSSTDGDPRTADERLAQSAQILDLMEAANSAAVFAAMETVDAIRLQDKMRALPPR